MYEQASFKVETEENNEGTSHLWHSIYFERYMVLRGLEKSTAYVLQTTEAMSVLQSLSLNSPNNTLE